MSQKRGFTLIELLVVIAIIGILASVVLASLNSARSKGNNAAVKSNLASVRAQAELYYDDNGSYGPQVSDGDCATAGSMFMASTTVDAIAAANSAGNGDAQCYTAGGTASAAQAWAISIGYKGAAAGDNDDWCVDSAGFGGTGKTAVAAGACQ